MAVDCRSPWFLVRDVAYAHMVQKPAHLVSVVQVGEDRDIVEQRTSDELLMVSATLRSSP